MNAVIGCTTDCNMGQAEGCPCTCGNIFRRRADAAAEEAIKRAISTREDAISFVSDVLGHPELMRSIPSPLFKKTMDLSREFDIGVVDVLEHRREKMDPVHCARPPWDIDGKKK